MSYDAPMRLTLTYPALNFVSGAANKKWRLPKGMRGRVVEIMTSVTTVFTTTTTNGKLSIGSDTTTNAGSYASLDMGAAAANSTLNATNQSGAIKTGTNATFITADTDFFINVVAPTGGSPTGVADVAIVIEIF